MVLSVNGGGVTPARAKTRCMPYTIMLRSSQGNSDAPSPSIATMAVESGGASSGDHFDFVVQRQGHAQAIEAGAEVGGGGRNENAKHRQFSMNNDQLTMTNG